VNAVQTVVAWAKRRPANPAPNGVQLLAWIILVATPIGLVYNVWTTYQADNVSKCEQRVNARSDVRGVFIGTFDYLDPEDTDSVINDLRAQLDATYPPITIDECLAGTV
jgi:hypothetical protein